MRRWPQAIVLDLDGTLVDSFPGIALALDRALAQMGRNPLGLPWVRDHVGRGLRRLAEDALPTGGPSAVEELVRRFGEAYDQVLEAATPAFPGVDRALERLAARCPLAVASNKPARWSRRLVDHLGWSRLVPVVLGPEDAGAPKPDPAMVLLALARLGAAAAGSLLVGDMEVDVETGLAAGVRVVGVGDDEATARQLRAAGAAAVLPGVSALPDWLERRCHESSTAPGPHRRAGESGS